MDGKIDSNAVLDYAKFQTCSRQNRFEVVICTSEKTENLSSGLLDQLLLHLPVAKDINFALDDSFKLQPTESCRDTSWFTKSTLDIFLSFVNASDVVKKVNAIHDELNQLEETRKFHLTLYTKDKESHFGNSATAAGCLEEMESIQKVKVETVSSDATKNELLRALDLRLLALKEELTTAFNRFLGANCSKLKISNLAAFVEHFGTSDLRNTLMRYLSLNFDDPNVVQPNVQGAISNDLKNCTGSVVEEKSTEASKLDSLNVARNGISPAKLAQAERRSPTDSEESSNSSEEDHSFAERSRPVIRSASPRRSASPMRRIQIGRSGSRRTTALTIKSLGFFPAREKILFNKEADENSSDDEISDQKPKKTENTVVRMSVQDRINLFESKQRDQTVDIQKKSTAMETSFGAKKSVLRRWSSGVDDSSIQSLQEITSDTRIESLPDNVVVSPEEKSTKATAENPLASSKTDGNATAAAPFGADDVPLENAVDFVPSGPEQTQDRAASSAEWTRQKEAELSEMLVKMMETKTSKYGDMTAEGDGNREPSIDQKGDFYSQYKEKRDKKLRAENAGKRAEKEAKFKVMQETLDKRKSEMTKKIGVTGKVNSAVQSQKVRRNSSPPVLTKKDTSNPVGSRKPSPKSLSPLPATRTSLPSTPPPRSAGTAPAKTSVMGSTCSVPKRRKPQSTPSSIRSAPQTERPRQSKGSKVTVTETKTDLRPQEEKKPKTVTKTNKNVREKSPAPTMDDSGTASAKPSFYNKVTRKNSVVPVESKPFLKKGTGIGSGGPAASKIRLSQSYDSPKNSGNIPHVGKESIVESVETVAQPPSETSTSPTNDVDMDSGNPIITDLPEKTELPDTFVTEVTNSVIQPAECSVIDIEPNEDLGISSAAWVEDEPQIVPESCQNDDLQVAEPADIVPMAITSPRVRHSLSQMLQADTTESDIIEWGNAENPPALVYQKDAPKGLKRLLKFARKSKGESNMTGWSSPSVFSDGEEDSEESKVLSRRGSDALSRKATLKTKTSGKQRNMLTESFDGGNSSKRLIDHSASHEILSASMSSFPSGFHKLRETNASATTSTKGSRSFFSLSTFRSNKTSEAKLR